MRLWHTDDGGRASINHLPLLLLFLSLSYFSLDLFSFFVVLTKILSFYDLFSEARAADNVDLRILLLPYDEIAYKYLGYHCFYFTLTTFRSICQ